MRVGGASSVRRRQRKQATHWYRFRRQTAERNKGVVSGARPGTLGKDRPRHETKHRGP